MKNRGDLSQFAKMLGIDEVYKIQRGKFTGTTVVTVRNGNKITVSDILKMLGYTKDFIEANFNVSDKKYSQALFVIKSMKMFYLNLNTAIPTKEQMHYTVDVFHEIEDMQTTCVEKQRANASIAFTLHAAIDWLKPSNGE